MNPFFAAMLFCAGLAIALIVIGPSLLSERTQRSTAAFLVGLLTGFATIALPMVMVPAVAVGVVLGMNYVREGRLRDLGLLLAGWGTIWTALWGWNAWNAATDAGVRGSSDIVGFLAVGIALLVAGVAIVTTDALRRARQD